MSFSLSSLLFKYSEYVLLLFQLLNGVSSKDPNVAIERTARLEMADALDLSENMV